MQNNSINSGLLAVIMIKTCHFLNSKAASLDPLETVRLGRHSVTWIGDSLTAGCWVMGKNPAEDYRAEANYAAVASDLLNARNVRIAYSAVGLSKPGTGGVPVLPEVLTAVDSKTTWQPVPTDLVVINVGTNDRHTDDTTFTVVLRRFLNQVQTLYPNSRLAVMIPFNQNFAAIIRAVVAEFMQLQLIETATWQLSTTDGVHLDLAGSRMAGELTAQALRTQYPDVFKS
nr:SGNH/GDSL hydrolase family protein [Lactiplantibacillus plantarum]